MGKVIQGQIIASTALDSHGDRMKPDQLRGSFEQLPEESFTCDAHDLSKPPVARGFNKRLERLADGELAIKLDIEVLDEEAFQRSGGFSLAYTGRTLRLGTGSPIIRILVNPRHFDLDAIVDHVPITTPDICVDVTERIEKGQVVPLAIVVISLLTVDALRETWRGYWNRAGGALFDYLKRMPRKDLPSGPRSVRISFPISWVDERTQVILLISPEVRGSELASLDLEYLAGVAVSICRGRSSDRLIGRIEPGPRVVFERLIDSSGRSHPIWVLADYLLQGTGHMRQLKPTGRRRW